MVTKEAVVKSESGLHNRAAALFIQKANEHKCGLWIEIDNRRVKMNVTIPAWVKELAAEKGLNSSRLLEAAILDAAQVRRPRTGHAG